MKCKMKFVAVAFPLAMLFGGVVLTSAGQFGPNISAGPQGLNVNNASPLSPGGTTPGPAGVNLTPMKQKMSFVSMESLEAEFFPASKIVSVKGSLKNISNSNIRGYITIFLMSQTGSVLTAFDMPVNDHRPFQDGESVTFDTAVNVSNVSGAFRVSVEFTRD